MARLINGYMGPFIGKLGTGIGSSRNGQHYIKSLYDRTAPPTEGEKANRNKFAMAQLWLQPVCDFVREGFRNYSQRSKGFVAAMSWLLKNSFEGVKPDITINPALVKVSHGDLPLSENITVRYAEDGHLHFTWDTSPVAGASVYDQVMLLAYNIEKGRACYKMTGQLRSTGADVLKISATPGRTHHVYVAFNAADRSRQSHSVYLGAINV